MEELFLCDFLCYVAMRSNAVCVEGGMCLKHNLGVAKVGAQEGR